MTKKTKGKVFVRFPETNLYETLEDLDDAEELSFSKREVFGNGENGYKTPARRNRDDYE